MKKVAILIDGPNLNLTCHQQGWRIDIGKIPTLIGADEDQIVSAKYYDIESSVSGNGKDPESFYEIIQEMGYQVVIEQREKDVDSQMIKDLFKLIRQKNDPITDIVIVSGDGVFADILAEANNDEIRTHLLSRSGNISGDFWKKPDAALNTIYLMESDSVRETLFLENVKTDREPQQEAIGNDAIMFITDGYDKRLGCYPITSLNIPAQGDPDATIEEVELEIEPRSTIWLRTVHRNGEPNLFIIIKPAGPT